MDTLRYLPRTDLAIGSDSRYQSLRAFTDRLILCGYHRTHIKAVGANAYSGVVTGTYWGPYVYEQDYGLA